MTLQLQASNPYSDPTAFAAPLGLPPGLRLDGATGLISGVIPFGVGGTFNVQITVRVRAQTASQIFTWTVRRNVPPILQKPAARLTNEGADVRLQLHATDVNADALTFGASGLPAGLTLDAATGLITGQPRLQAVQSAQRSFTVSIWVDDVWGARASQSFVWTINQQPAVVAPAPADRWSRAGHAIVPFDVSFVDFDGDDITLAVTALPAGLVWHPPSQPRTSVRGRSAVRRPRLAGRRSPSRPPTRAAR